MLLPLPVELSLPRLAIFLAATALAAATFVGLAGLETAAAMQVLNRDRRVPPPLPAHAAAGSSMDPRTRRGRALGVERPPDWPASAVPGTDDLPPGTRLRCTVLVPAHDEEAVLAAHAGRRWRARPGDRTGCW